MKRILPLHPDSINHKWSEETIKFESEKWCKPFFVIVQRCLDVRVRPPEQVEQCKLSPILLEKCVADVMQNMKSIIEDKKKNCTK